MLSRICASLSHRDISLGSSLQLLGYQMVDDTDDSNNYQTIGVPDRDYMIRTPDEPF